MKEEIKEGIKERARENTIKKYHISYFASNKFYDEELVKETARTIFEALKCPECNECETYEEAWDMLVNLIEKVKKEFGVEK